MAPGPGLLENRPLTDSPEKNILSWRPLRLERVTPSRDEWAVKKGLNKIRMGGVSVAYRVTVDAEKCKGCEECVEVCTVSVFEMKDDKSRVVKDDECIGCRSCVDVCKEQAIIVEELQTEMSEIARLLFREIL